MESVDPSTVQRVELYMGQERVASLTPRLSEPIIRRLVGALKGATIDERIGKGGGRPDRIMIFLRDGNLRPKITIRTDFSRTRELLGKEAQIVIDNILGH